MAKEPITGMYEVLDALKAVIKAAPKAERNTLAAVMDAYAKDFPADYFWATGAQSPVLVHHLIHAIEAAATDEGQGKGRVVHLITRKPEGNA